MSRFFDIDLARLPALPLPTLDFDAVFAARIAELTERLREKGIEFTTGGVDGDPLTAVEQAGAYRELVVQARVNDSVRAVMLASAWGAFLDHLGATQVPALPRKPLAEQPRDFATYPEDWEADDDYRKRIQLAPEALATAGPEGAYLFFALATEGVKAASCYGPMSFGGSPMKPFIPLGEVHIPIVSKVGDGSASADLVAAVERELRADERRPIADFVSVFPATILPYRLVVRLTVGAGADRGAVQAEAERRLRAQANRQHRAGAAARQRQFYSQAFIADASGVNVVEDVEILEPSSDVNGGVISADDPSGAYCAPYCTEVVVIVEVSDD